jgi:RNA polymerase sigma-70 factor, ECF subfamily
VYPKRPSDRNESDVTGSVALRLETGALSTDAPAAPDEEALLVARCLQGDAEAFRPLVLRHQRQVFAVAYRMLGRRADAEDVAQQAFVDAYAALDRFSSDGRGGNAFGSWLLRIAINRCKDVLKSKKRTEESLGDEPGDGAIFSHRPADPEAKLLEARHRSSLERALASLPPKYREVLVLKDVEELPYEEIREILRLPITTLKIRVLRARGMMREALTGQEGGHDSDKVRNGNDDKEGEKHS